MLDNAPTRLMRVFQLILIALLAAATRPSFARVEPPVEHRISAIDRVWSSHSVPFGLAVNDRLIVVAYYDANRQITVASRARTGSSWRLHKLDSWTNWDSHNGIAVAIDASGSIHVAGNMHNDPLVYFRSAPSGDVRTLKRASVMTDLAIERSVTYPAFLRDGEGQLVFKYRDGGSGRGREIYNIYDEAAGRWTPLLHQPLVDGEGKRSAYFVGPTMGTDGRFHLTWVWRDTPDAATNHSLSYARSRDLVNWESSDGSPLRLPITLSTAEIVDPVRVRQGMINNNTMIGFDQAGRPLIAYHKFDGLGRTQVFIARRDEKNWSIHQASNWQDFRWDFGGMGSLDSRLTLEPAIASGNDHVRVPVVRDGKATVLVLDSANLELVEEVPISTLRDRLAKLIGIPGGTRLNVVDDTSGIAIAWAAVPPQRDVPGRITDPTTLYLVEPTR